MIGQKRTTFAVIASALASLTTAVEETSITIPAEEPEPSQKWPVPEGEIKYPIYRETKFVSIEEG